mgnify:CR=1 FL=1
MNGDSEQDLQRAEWRLGCAEREKGGKGGGLAHTADSGIASALPPRSGTDGRATPHGTKDDGQRSSSFPTSNHCTLFQKSLLKVWYNIRVPSGRNPIECLP